MTKRGFEFLELCFNFSFTGTSTGFPNGPHFIVQCVNYLLPRDITVSCRIRPTALHPLATGGTAAQSRPRHPITAVNALHNWISQFSASSWPFPARQLRMFTHSFYIKPTHSAVYQTKPVVLSCQKAQCQYSCLRDRAQQKSSACLTFTLFSNSTCKALSSASKYSQVTNSKSWNWTSYLAIKLFGQNHAAEAMPESIIYTMHNEK